MPRKNILQAFLVFFAFFMSNFSAFFNTLWLVPQTVVAISAFWLYLALVSVWILATKKSLSSFLEIVKRNWFIFPFLVFSAISIFWSISWEISLYKWLTFLFTIIVGGAIGVCYDLKEISILLSGFGLWILIISAYLIFFIPYIGVMNYHIIQGAWRGLYWHKNHFGLIASFINLLFLINLIESIKVKEKQKYAWGLLYLLSLFFIYKSDSVAAYFTTLCLTAGIFIAFLWLRFRKKIRRIHYGIFFSVLILLFFAAFLNRNLIFGIFNRNASLTGRVPMWTFLLNTYLSKRPVLGYGFNAFWYDNLHRIAVQAAAHYPDPIVISDNGFIDILMSTGVVGLLLFLLFYFGIWWRAAKLVKQAKDLFGFFPLILMCFTLIANISWSLLFENESFFMLSMVTVLFSISKISGDSVNDPVLQAIQ